MRRAAAVAVSVVLVMLAGLPARASHGPAPITVGLLPDPGRLAAAPEATPLQSRYPWAIPRTTADRPDLTPDPTVHVIYLLPAGEPDEQLDTLGILEDSLRAQNVWMRDQTGRQWRLDTFEFSAFDSALGAERTVEAVDVTFVRSELPASELNGGFAIADELARLGFDDEGKRYLSYVASDGRGACGDAIAPVLLAPESTGDGKYAQVYLDSPEGCGTRAFATDPTDPSFSEAVAQHELVHNDGMVRVGAPHHCLASVMHICTGVLALGLELDPEYRDLMFPYVGPPLPEKVLDRGRDDYFGDLPYRGLEASPYLEPAPAT